MSGDAGDRSGRPTSAGTYKKVFVYVSDVNATLKSDERVDVKLPSNHLQIKKRFTVEQEESVSFVFRDSLPAGHSTYVIKPVVSDSGTNVSFCHRNGRASRPNGRAAVTATVRATTTTAETIGSVAVHPVSDPTEGPVSRLFGRGLPSDDPDDCPVVPTEKARVMGPILER